MLALLFIILAVEAITEIIVASDLLVEFRGWFSRQENPVLHFISRLVTCGYCCSVWVSVALAWSVPLSLTEYWFIDVVIKTFAIHRMANWFHEFMSRWLSRHPWTCVLHKVGDNNDQEGHN